MTQPSIEYVESMHELSELLQKRIKLQIRQAQVDKEILGLLERQFAGVTGEKKKLIAKKKNEMEAIIGRVWSKHIEARVAFFLDRNGRKPTNLPDLTADLILDIKKAIQTHGEEKATAAGIGIFFDPWMAGGNPDGKLFLEPFRVWRIKRGKDHVERFANAYYQELEGE